MDAFTIAGGMNSQNQQIPPMDSKSSMHSNVPNTTMSLPEKTVQDVLGLENGWKVPAGEHLINVDLDHIFVATVSVHPSVSCDSISPECTLPESIFEVDVCFGNHNLLWLEINENLFIHPQ